jgi:hypothetical protein
MLLKAQLSYDFIIAAFVFFLVVSVLLLQWAGVTSQIDETRYLDDLIEKAYLTSDVWFRSGVPNNWNKTNVISLGFKDNYEFNQTKMNSLTEIGYNASKQLLGLGDVEYYFLVYDETNTTLFNFGSMPSNSRDVIKVKRAGILNSSFVFLDAVVWK